MLTLPQRLALVLVIAALAACDSTDPGGGGETPPEGTSINEVVENLSYDPDELLNVQPADAETAGQTENDPPIQDGLNLIQCTRTEYSLAKNFDRVAILRPTTGVVWPGALVKGNDALLDGVPEPISLDRAPVTVRVNLPGIGSNGTRTVEDPANSSVSAAVDDALEWWNANAYEDGYVNASQSSFSLSQSFSRQQVALDVGMTAEWATGDASAQFGFSSDEETMSLLAVYKQAFYDVTLDTPSSPGAVFGPDVSADDLRREVSASAPPAYVSSVTYGRIIMARMETSAKLTRAEFEAEARNAFTATTVTGDVRASYEKLNDNLSITVVTLGGNAAVATQAISTSSPQALIDGMQAVIQGENAVYSRDNPGVPIAYQVRYLKGNRLAKLGYTTDYTATECSAMKNMSRITMSLDDFKVVKDCDAGPGDFRLYTSAWRSDDAGDWVNLTRVTKEGEYDDGTTVNIDENYTFDLPNRSGQRFRVFFKATEFDGFSQDRPDPDMGSGEADRDYDWQSAGWSNLNDTGRYTLTVGSDNCKAELNYRVSVQ